MKKLTLTTLVAFFITMQLVFTQSATAQTSGQVTFTFKTVTENGTYAPKHVLAAWIEKDGVFVKTRLVRANNRKQYLYTWKSQSNSNEVDAITGSTITSHQTQTIVWDCTDLDGNTVPNGDYVIWAEFTEKHAQGPLVDIAFFKGADEVHLTPVNENNFIDMTLDYVPDGVGIDDQKNPEQITAYPNPSSGIFNLKNPHNQNLQVVVFTLSGKEITRQEVSPQTNNQVNLSAFGKGNYLLRITGNSDTQIIKVTVI